MHPPPPWADQLRQLYLAVENKGGRPKLHVVKDEINSAVEPKSASSQHFLSNDAPQAVIDRRPCKVTRAMNKSAIVAAFVIAVGLIAFAWSPRYTMTNIGDGRVARLDRWTGNLVLCGNWADGSFSCSDAVKYHNVAEVWRDATPEEMAQASAANQADEDAKSAASSARRAGEEAAQAASNAAKEAADAMRH